MPLRNRSSPSIKKSYAPSSAMPISTTSRSGPDGVRWDGIEYYDAQHARGLVYAFRGSAPDHNEHAFRLYGLDSGRQYRLHFQDGSASDHTESGSKLLSTGLNVALPVPNSSELVFRRS